MALTYVVPRSWYRSTRSDHGGRTREVLIGQDVELLREVQVATPDSERLLIELLADGEAWPSALGRCSRYK